jgi:AAA+ superfamily predicted ATPase
MNLKPRADKDVLRELEILVRSKYPILLLQSDDEDQARFLVKHLAEDLKILHYTWTCTRGMRQSGMKEDIFGTKLPLPALEYAESSISSGLIYLEGLGSYLSDPRIIQKLKDLADVFSSRFGALVLAGEDLNLPDSLLNLSARVTLPPPRVEDYILLLRKVVASEEGNGKVRVNLPREEMLRLLHNVRGFTLKEAEKLFRRLIVSDRALTAEDIDTVILAKREIVEKEGLLEYSPAEAGMGDVAGLARLKDWLGQRREFILHPDRMEAAGLPFPKGILLIGVPGCGKSLCAKAVARDWGLPLLRLDPAVLYDKYIGESERKFRKAMRTAERMAPVVLWIDEIEKAFASAAGEEDGGLSRRILGAFLSWLQERRGDVFVAATSNDIFALPPELVRKGRFDEIFFLDLPDAAARREIFALHLNRLNKTANGFNLEALAGDTEGYSGAEIEQAVVAARYAAAAAGKPLDGALLAAEMGRTHPLSRTMRERITQLREWARGRAQDAT